MAVVLTGFLQKKQSKQAVLQTTFDNICIYFLLLLDISRKYSRKEVEGMLDQILTLTMSNVQLITAALIFAAVVLELVHIGQTRRINKRLSRAGHWLQRYLNAVFHEDAYEEQEKEETNIRTGIKTNTEEEIQLSVAQPVRSRQEENMRTTLAQKKQKKEEELLDTVLQEIFD